MGGRANLPSVPYVTAGQAAKILGISRQAVHERIKRGTLVPCAVTPDGAYAFGRGYIEGVRDAMGANAVRPTAGETETGPATAATADEA